MTFQVDPKTLLVSYEERLDRPPFRALRFLTRSALSESESISAPGQRNSSARPARNAARRVYVTDDPATHLPTTGLIVGVIGTHMVIEGILTGIEIHNRTVGG